MNKCSRCKKILIGPAMYCNPCFIKLVKCGELLVLKTDKRAHSIIHTGKGGKEIWEVNNV